MSAQLIAIVGETASGKSGLAYQLAQDLNGEIICADSWSVYTGFDIGSAKPIAAERVAVRHHLLDVADPVVGFSAAVFKRLAEAAIVDIRSRGRLPIIAGGTGLYVDSVLYDYEFLPAPLPEVRGIFNDLSISELLQLAMERGLPVDRIDIRNKRRIIRLLENNGLMPGRSPLRDNTTVIGLRVERAVLQQQIIARVDSMIQQGLEAEVRTLSQQYGWDIEAMKGIGYREWQNYFAGAQPLETTRQQIIRNTMLLAKKQRTWFGRNPDIIWFDTAADAAAFIKSKV